MDQVNNDKKNLQEKWNPLLEHEDLPKIGDSYRRSCTAVLLENQNIALKESASADTTNVTGGVSKWDPVLISLVRRATPNLMAFDIAGVQPMTGPTGLLFALRSRYNGQAGNEALFQEADTDFGGAGVHGGDSSGFQAGDLVASPADPADSTTNGVGIDTAVAEKLGTEGLSPTQQFAEMGFTIEKTTVTAKTRALKAEYSIELAQDLKAIHGLDAETELANILSSEILAEINREFIRTINVAAKLGAQTSAQPAVFDLDVDADGRWSLEKWKGLLFQLEREANQIAKDTRRGKGNVVICSSNVASALSLAGVLEYAPELNTNLSVDDTGNTFAGILNNRLRVYVDPYATIDYITVGYRGVSPFDAGVFYCPYVPLQMVKAVGEDSFQPKLGFKTRYGIVANPFTTIVDGHEANSNAVGGQSGLGAGQNFYYRKFAVRNLLGTAI